MFSWLLHPNPGSTGNTRKTRRPYDPELDRKIAIERMNELRRSLPFRRHS